MATSKAEPGVVPGQEGLVVRRCSDISEFAACVDLQKEVWQFSDIDIVPIRMFFQPPAQAGSHAATTSSIRRAIASVSSGLVSCANTPSSDDSDITSRRRATES